MNTRNGLARIAGILYLSLLPLGLFGIMYVPNFLAVPGDAAATIDNIAAAGTLFRLSIVSGLLTQLVNIVLVLVLYRLLRPVNASHAALMVVFFLVSAPIAMLNQLNHFAVAILLSGADYLAVLSGAQQQSLIAFFLDLHQYGVTIAQIFWGLWLFPMGYLVFKSGFLPRLIGILLMIGCFGYLVDSFSFFIFPETHVSVAAFTFWGEILLPLWLVIKGAGADRQPERVPEFA